MAAAATWAHSEPAHSTAERRHMINDALKRKLRGFPTGGLGLRVVTA
jgi:hypothetical protein